MSQGGSGRHGGNRVKPPDPTLVHKVIDEYERGQMALTEALQQLTGRSGNSTATNTPVIEKSRLLSLLTELDALVGLDEVKRIVREIFAYVYVQQSRVRQHLKADPVVLHMVFFGNPGTGKTTVARLLARLFHECGLLSQGHLVEVERADLVGEYIGHTAQKTREHIKKALGGVLFIDEAYSLARGGDKDFGREAIDCLVKGMEDYKNQFIAILAGYEREMEWFLSMNPGLPSRFPIHIHFPDYDADALLKIAKRALADRQYRMSVDAEITLRRRIQEVLREVRQEPFSNARWVRNVVEDAVRRQAVRLFEHRDPKRDDLMLIEAADFAGGARL
nr:AAA family ATPase [Alicyclobacillus acidiphilus]